jgi:hypothetical protein
MAVRQKSGKGRLQVEARVRVTTHVGSPLEIPMAFEAMLYHHLGLESMEGIHRASSLNYWRRCMYTHFTAMAKVVRDTVEGDSEHKTELMALCNAAAASARGAKTYADLLTGSVAKLALLSFRLLGGWPVQAGKRRGGLRNWSLARYRSVLYTRSATQRASQILDCALFRRDAFKEAVPSFLDLADVKRKQCKGDDYTFVEWFRRKFPRSYSALS